MPLRTTVIGCYPKPSYLTCPDWFRGGKDMDPRHFNAYLTGTGASEHKQLVERAKQEVMSEQAEVGIDVITDGEIERENYIYHFLRRVRGFDFDQPKEMQIRNNACTCIVPVIRSKVFPADPAPWVHKEWQENQSRVDVPVKITLPGPMTIIGTTANEFYENDRDLSLDLVKCLNREILALSEAGCQFIQLDEPLIARQPEKALEYGIDHLSMCFEGVGKNVTKVIHLCNGYPSYLDQTDYLKADPNAYQMTAEKLDQAGFDQISLEDAHRHNHLSLFDKFKKTTIILGVVAVARSDVESVDDVRERVTSVLRHIPRERLVLAPDCGLGYLPRNILKEKLVNLVEAAKSF